MPQYSIHIDILPKRERTFSHFVPKLHDLQNIPLHIGTLKAPVYWGWWQWQCAWMSCWLGTLEAALRHQLPGECRLGSWHHWRGTGQRKTVVAAHDGPVLFGESRWDALWGLPEGALVGTRGEDKNRRDSDHHYLYIQSAKHSGWCGLEKYSLTTIEKKRKTK